MSGQQFFIIICLVCYYIGGEFVGDDVVYVFLEQWCYDFFQLFGQCISVQFCWVGEVIYYQGDVVLFQCFGDGFLVELNQFFCICWIGIFCYQFVEVQQRICLQYVVKDGLFVYQVRFYFCYEGRFQYVCVVVVCCCSLCFGNCYVFVFWVVFWVYCDKCWYVEIVFVFFMYFGVWVFWCYYYYGDVFMDLFVYFYDVEVVGVIQCCVVFYQWLYGVYNV